MSQFPAFVMISSTYGSPGAVVPQVLAILSSLLCLNISMLKNHIIWLQFDYIVLGLNVQMKRKFPEDSIIKA